MLIIIWCLRIRRMINDLDTASALWVSRINTSTCFTAWLVPAWKSCLVLRPSISHEIGLGITASLTEFAHFGLLLLEFGAFILELEQFLLQISHVLGVSSGYLTFWGWWHHRYWLFLGWGAGLRVVDSWMLLIVVWLVNLAEIHV